MKTAVEVKDLSMSYGKVEVLANINLAFKSNQINALVGPSGCGKSSFLQCINRLIDLIPEASVKGDIELFGESVFDLSGDLSELRKRIGMIFQKPAPFPLSIRNNFHLALKEHGISHYDEREAKMEDSLRRVGLWREVKDRLKENADKLSGGQKQRLCIARALSLKPEVLLMDEPCSALDPISSGAVEELISGLRKNYTVILVTHNLNQAKRVADYAAFFWVKDGVGCLVEQGESQDIFNSPKSELTKAYVNGAAG